MTNTENLKSLLEHYNRINNEPTEEIIVEQEPKPIISFRSHNEIEDTPQMKLEYSAEKVEYFNYNNYIYRREVSNNTISWEIISGNIANKITEDVQINILEKRISNIAR
jgi:hypothetical protein